MSKLTEAWAPQGQRCLHFLSHSIASRSDACKHVDHTPHYPGTNRSKAKYSFRYTWTVLGQKQVWRM